jgi:hypothetical protein
LGFDAPNGRRFLHGSAKGRDTGRSISKTFAARIKNSIIIVLQETAAHSLLEGYWSPRKKQEKRYEHVMEDVFLDHGYAQDLDEDYHFDER